MWKIDDDDVKEIILKDLQKVTIKDTDTIVLQMDNVLPTSVFNNYAKMLYKVMTKAFPDGNILILPAGLTIGVLGKECERNNETEIDNPTE